MRLQPDGLIFQDERNEGLVRRGFSKYSMGVRRTFGVEGRFDVAARVARYG